MAKPSSKTIADSILELRWLVWSVIRTHPEYQADVVALIEEFRRLRRRKRFIGNIEQHYRIVAADTANSAYKALRKIAKELKSLPQPFSLREAQLTRLRNQITETVSLARRSSFLYPMTSVQQAPNAADNGADAIFLTEDTGGPPTSMFPELDRFHLKWGLRFPLPPELPLPKEMDNDLINLPASRPIEVLSEGRNKIELRIWPVVSKQLLLEWAIGAVQASEYVAKTSEGKVLSRKARVADPVVVPLSDGFVKATVNLPYDLKTLRSTLRSYLTAPGFRLREIEEAVKVAELRDLPQSKRQTFARIASIVFGNRQMSGEPRQMALARYRLFKRLQSRLLPSISTL